MSHSQTSGWTLTPRVSGSGCPREPVNLGWDGLPGDRESRETGVGKNEHAPADMRRTKIASRELNSGAVEASSRQTARDFGFPFRVARGLLHDKPFCAGVDADTQHLGPEAFAGPLAVDGGGDAGGLAGRASDDDVSGHAGEGPHVVMDGDAGEMMGDETAPAGLDLTEADDAEAAGGAEAEGMTSDVAEKIEDIHGSGLR